MKPFFDDIPLIHWKIAGWRPVGYMVEHWTVLLEASTAEWSVNQFAQIVHYEMRAMAPKLFGIALARDPDYEAKSPCRPGLHSRKRVLYDNRPPGLNPEQLCSRQKCIRSGFPG